jgi:hypothetical protein
MLMLISGYSLVEIDSCFTDAQRGRDLLLLLLMLTGHHPRG